MSWKGIFHNLSGLARRMTQTSQTYSHIIELDYDPRLGDMQDLPKDAYSSLEARTQAGWKDYPGFIVQHGDYAIKGRYSRTLGPMGLLH